MTDIDAISRIQYEAGVDPIEWAAYLAACQIEARDLARSGQIARGVAVTLLPLDDLAVGRRIVAKLLDAGWSAPVIEPEEAP